MTGKNNSADTPSNPVEAELDGKENSIEKKDGALRPGFKNRLRDIPPRVQKSYVEIDGKYFFVKRPDSLAFQDKGHKLETTFRSTQIAGSMIDIAQAKGWSKIKVKGDISFRREVWLHAAARGLNIKGYTPQDEDLARLKKLGPELPKDREKKEFKNAKALLNKNTNFVELAKENPELINDIAAIKVGEKLSLNMSTETDRELFMAKIRERIADNYLQRQRIPPIKIKQEKTVERPVLEKEIEKER